MRYDIYGGLKNALSRGIPLEKAVQSFINAGYNPLEVREAAQHLSSGFQGQPQTSQPSQTPNYQQNSSSNYPSYTTQNLQSSKPLVDTNFSNNQNQQVFSQYKDSGKQIKRKNISQIVILGFILIILIGVLISVIIYRNDLIEFLSNLF